MRLFLITICSRACARVNDLFGAISASPLGKCALGTAYITYLCRYVCQCCSVVLYICKIAAIAMCLGKQTNINAQLARVSVLFDKSAHRTTIWRVCRQPIYVDKLALLSRFTFSVHYPCSFVSPFFFGGEGGGFAGKALYINTTWL